jgi:hypothetical protein
MNSLSQRYNWFKNIRKISICSRWDGEGETNENRKLLEYQRPLYV